MREFTLLVIAKGLDNECLPLSVSLGVEWGAVCNRTREVPKQMLISVICFK